MKSGVFFFFLLILSMFSQVIVGQKDVDVVENKWDAKKNAIHASFNYFAGSDAITNSFIDAAFSNGLITNKHKQQVLNRLDEKNRLGYNLDYGVQYNFNTKKAHHFVVGLKSREHLNAGFNKNLFRLVFEGNKPLAGKYANLDPFKYTYFSYEQLSLGIGNFDSYNNLFGFQANLNILKGSRFHQANIDVGDFFTDSQGTYISYDADMKFQFADESKSKICSFNGYGASLDIYLFYVLDKLFSANGFVSLRIEDLGFINWSGIETYAIDQEYEFSGGEVNNFFGSTDSLLSGLGFDSMSDLLGLQSTSTDKWYFLPAKVSLECVLPLKYRFQAAVGANYVFNCHYLPKVYAMAGVEVWKKYLLISPIISYGGYSNFDYGLGISSFKSDLYYIRLMLHFFEDWINPEKSTGQGLMINTSFYF